MPSPSFSPTPHRFSPSSPSLKTSRSTPAHSPSRQTSRNPRRRPKTPGFESCSRTGSSGSSSVPRLVEDPSQLEVVPEGMWREGFGSEEERSRTRRWGSSREFCMRPKLICSSLTHIASTIRLLPLLRESLKHALSLQALGFTPLQITTLLSLPTPLPDLFDGLVDASDRPEGSLGITSWLNDLEKEPKYASWRSDFRTVSRRRNTLCSCSRGRATDVQWLPFFQLLRPSQPGAIPQLRRNIFNVVFAIDLSSVSGVDVLTGQVNQLVQRGLGVRFGFVPMLDGQNGDGECCPSS